MLDQTLSTPRAPHCDLAHYRKSLVSFVFSRDLVDAVVDHCSSDICTLKKCSLVSRSWLASARRHLLKEVTVRDNNSDGFIEFITSITPYLRNRIRSVRLETCSSAWLADFIPKLSATLGAKQDETGPKITTLIVETYHCRFPPEAIPALRAFKFVEALWLVDCDFQWFFHVQNVICSFPCLRTLVLRDITWQLPRMHFEPSDGDAAGDLEIEPRPPATLREIVLRCEKRPFLYWLFKAPATPLMTKIVASNITDDETFDLGLYLRRCKSLTHLVLGFDSAATGYLKDIIDLSQNDQLESFGLVMDGWTEDLAFARAMIIRAIRSPSSRLEEVKLWFEELPRFDRFSARHAHDWGSLDLLLVYAHEKRSLKKVTLGNCIGVWTMDDRLKECAERDLLQYP